LNEVRESTVGVMTVEAGQLTAAQRVMLGATSCDIGNIHLRDRDLPPGCPAALLAEGDELWLIFDATQPLARRHACALLQQQNDQMPRQVGRSVCLPSPRRPARWA
jgi:hypothetical protein